MECDDVLVPVGQDANITARLGLTDLFRLGFKLKGRVVRFRVDGGDIGEARSAWDGCATVTFTPALEREYRVVATCLDVDGRQAAAVEATIFSRSTQREAIIVDIDRTLSESSVLDSTFKRNKRISPLNDAADVTRDLVQKYDLIIVTGRKRYLRRKTRRWLADNGFPPAPIYCSSFLRGPLRHERFKTKLIGELKHAWENITIGIGDRDSDARAYLANGLRAIILREKGCCPRGATMVSHWKGIRKILLG